MQVMPWVSDDKRWRLCCLALCLSTGALLAGCGQSTGIPSHSSKTPVGTFRTGTSTAEETAVTRRRMAYLRSQGYTPDRHVYAPLRDGTYLDVYHSVCTGSADGHCQDVDVFRGDSTRPIWQRQYSDVLVIAIRETGFEVRAANYAPSDPLCCPTGKPVTDVYVWTGQRFIEEGPTPGLPSN